MTPDTLFTILEVIGGIGAVLVLGSALWALFVRRDRRYREMHRKHLEQQSRVDERLSESSSFLNEDNS